MMECLQLNSLGKIIHRPVLHRMSRLFFFCQLPSSTGSHITLSQCCKTELICGCWSHTESICFVASVVWITRSLLKGEITHCLWSLCVPVAPVNLRLLVRSANAELKCKTPGSFLSTEVLHLNRPLCIFGSDYLHQQWKLLYPSLACKTPVL